ncbi:hypothetical protein [uncultured Spongiibacter sp.]|uniref:GAP1-N1 domain-containing protein n=1 Tax=uncultured Spongiibacter sp. TaxID=870896 RepID=UPI002599F4F1|nr:hypothetical protein [uncultured Spongiibacter sp.]
MIVIHQAIYGEVRGKTSGHGMLASSDDKNEIFKRVSGFTDLADRPEGGVLLSPVERAIFADDYFLLIKTFPDKTPGLRSGRVFSHVLFVNKNDLQSVKDIAGLFQYHLSEIQKDAKMIPLVCQGQDIVTATGAISEREGVATDALLKNQTFVWLGKEGFWEWVTKIWPRLPIKERFALKIGAAFNPSYVKFEFCNLLYIPQGVETLWERSSFRVISKDESQTLGLSATNWLLGEPKKAAPFQTLLDDFSPKIDSLEMLNRLESHGEAYHQIESNPELNRLLVLANLISSASPGEESGIRGKDRLLAAILQAIPDAPIDMILALMYQSWAGFSGATDSVSDALRNWLSIKCFGGKREKKCGSVLVKALESESKNWWVRTVLGYVNDRLKEKKNGDAFIIWEWMIDNHELFSLHASWLPDNVEDLMSLKLPKLDKEAANAALLMAKQKGWLLLHAKVAPQVYSVEKAIEAQLRIDIDESHIEALRVMSECLKESSFVSVAASHTDVRLYHLAGNLILKNGNLLKGMDFSSQGWQKCWEVAVIQGSDVWSGISNPQKTLFEILDHLQAGNSFSQILLKAMSHGEYGSLKDYPPRACIWRDLPDEVRPNFISNTLVELVDDLAEDRIKYSDLESELKAGLKTNEIRQLIIESVNIPITKKLRLFDIESSFNEWHVQRLIKDNRFSLVESEALGRLVSRRKWGKIVGQLYNSRTYRKDLVPGLLKCQQLLTLWERIQLSLDGMKIDTVSDDEWWQTFLSSVVQLYPMGPIQNGVWINAGGKQDEIHHGVCSGIVNLATWF